MKRIAFVLLLLGIFSLASCNKETSRSEEKKVSKSDDKDLIVIESEDQTIRIRKPEDLANEMERRMKDIEKGSAEELVDFQKLKDLLPSRLGWFVRKEHKGQRAGVAGFGASSAEAKYVSGQQTMEVSMADLGPMAGLVGAIAVWANVEMDNTTETGYERTITVQGYKAMETFDRASKTGELNILVGDRFMVHLQGEQIKERTLSDAAEKLALKKLERLAD
ncbi:MAG: hypothetical protein IPI11_06805 [Haliscomenobacter sp.]|nr:hypothetical protein [Haliscomenobacter sp.]